MFKTAVASLAGLGLIVVGTGLTGAEAAFVLGLGLFGYNVAVLASLALRDSIEKLGLVFDAWAQLEPTPAWYGRAGQYVKKRSTTRSAGG